MTFPTISRRVLAHGFAICGPAANAVGLTLLALFAVSMCSCKSTEAPPFFVPRSGTPHADHRQSQSAPLPSPAYSASIARQQQILAQQQLGVQSACPCGSCSNKPRVTHAASVQGPQPSQPLPMMLQQAPRAAATVMPVAFNNPVAPAAPAELVSNSPAPPCTAPYCLDHNGTPGSPHSHGGPRYYLPGPDAPNLGGFRDDEFLCDGGDSDVEVVIGQDWSVYGLNLEDTVGHYDTLDGERVVEPSNKVCIYAPRFAAVRQVRQAVGSVQRVKSAGVAFPEQLAQQNTLQIASTKVQQIQPLGELGRTRPVTFEDRTRGMTVDNTLGPNEFVNRFGVHENFQVIRIGLHQQSEKAFLAKSIEAAAVWETKEAVQVVVDTKHVHVQKGLAAAEEVDHYEERGEPKMRVIKVASTRHANPGDEIDFTIRFDNTGDEKIGNVTIIDNLTTRLEYVPDSAQCNVKADFLTQLNEGESLILRWEIIDPLEPGEGGIIRFKCRVR